MSTRTKETHLQWLRRLVVVVFAIAIMQHLLPPNGFSGTVLLFDYEFGMIRRGLLGALANYYFGENASVAEVLTFSALMSLFGLFSLMILAARSLFDGLHGLLVALLLFTSFAFNAIVGSTGYMDMVLIGMVALVMLTDPARVFGILLRIIVVCVGVFIHEAMLPYFAVFISLEIWMRCRDERAVARWAKTLIPFLAALVAFGAVTEYGKLPVDQIPAYIEYIQAKAGFSTDPEATVVLERSLADNMAFMNIKRAEMGYRGWVILDGIPLLLMTFWLIWLNLRILPEDSGSLTKLLLVGAILAPTSLNVIAFDVVRFGSTSVLIGFLTVISQLRSNPRAYGRLKEIITWPLFVVILVLNQSVVVTQINVGDAQKFGFPWALVEQLGWVKSSGQ